MFFASFFYVNVADMEINVILLFEILQFWHEL